MVFFKTVRAWRGADSMKEYMIQRSLRRFSLLVGLQGRNVLV